MCSPKYDGIRCTVKSGYTMSRTFKLLPSYQVQEEFKRYEHCDGELVEGQPNDPGVYNRTQSFVMSEDKPGDIKFFVFDYTHPDALSLPFHERFKLLDSTLGDPRPENVILVEQVEVDDEESLLAYEERVLALGFEGLILRSPVGIYKQGRATWKEGIIYKLKRFQDDEATIIGFEEAMTNTNEQKRDALGYAERSTSKEGMVPAGTLGKFIVTFRGQEITVAPGAFDHASRKKIWDDRDNFLGKILKFRHFTHGVKEKPRFPRAIGFRSLLDM